MNTQLQRMMVVLFLFLTIIAVTVLFWLPVNNDSNRILVAKESASNGLLSSEARDVAQNDLAEQDVTIETVEETPSAEAELLLTEAEDNSDMLADSSLSSDDNSLRRELESATSEDSTASAMPAAVTRQLPEDGSYAYDVMGNKRTHVTDHTVQKNDWFSTVTGQYWNDLFMWPDLYTMNGANLKSNNPDLIYPGEKISIYESLNADGEFSDEDRRTLLSAYLKVYKAYKQVGDYKDLAAAQLLASAVRYDKNFLKDHSDVIAPKDREMAERLIREQRFLD